MEIKTRIYYEENFLPTKRCRKEETRKLEKETIINVKEMLDKDIPIAFIIKSHSWEGDDFIPMNIEIRTYNGKLYQIKRFSEVACGAKGNMPIEYLKRMLTNGSNYCYENPKWNDESSIVTSSNFEKLKKQSQSKADNYFIFNGCVWKECDEPRYVINTFGLGHNHGGTGMFVEQYYNSNIPKSSYFTALQRKEAIEYADKVASVRGDTNDVGKFNSADDIIVLLPEAVKCNPAIEAGDGDPFINNIESMINKTESSGEAAILTMAMGLQNFRR